MSGTTVFLDRDGVINEDSPDYIKCWADFSFIQSSLDAVARFSRSGCSVITNQSAVNRGMIPLAELESMHRRPRRAAGCGRTILVQTGNGKAALRSLDENGQRPDPVAADLNRAVQWILDRPGSIP
ncbi:MAG: hypothetical protein KFF68_00830 [Desulfosarcina sp.]|nr:hypothetical protein [Desulfosarcina sp.]